MMSLSKRKVKTKKVKGKNADGTKVTRVYREVYFNGKLVQQKLIDEKKRLV